MCVLGGGGGGRWLSGKLKGPAVLGTHTPPLPQPSWAAEQEPCLKGEKVAMGPQGA